jgi:hypothetical protein
MRKCDRVMVSVESRTPLGAVKRASERVRTGHVCNVTGRLGHFMANAKATDGVLSTRVQTAKSACCAMDDSAGCGRLHIRIRARHPDASPPIMASTRELVRFAPDLPS